MSLLDQEVDSIIASENITDATPAVAPDDLAPTSDPVSDPTPVAPEAIEDPTTETLPAEAPVVDATIEGSVEATVSDPTPVAQTDERSPTEATQEARGIIQNLNLTEDKIFDDKGEVRPFNEVVPPGAYLASQLDPVRVTDKDGKEHEFLLISDVEKMFPDGFEAKNNLEQLKFEKAIMANEAAFDSAVKTYKGAETAYVNETSDMMKTRGESERMGNEYRAMAEAGLVPKVEGNANDSKFLESAAVKELNGILEWMDTENKANAAKGLGQITSLYIAKQLMDIQVNKEAKDDKKQSIIDERREVASLSASPTPETASKKEYRDIPLSRLADEIIASEGLK